MISRFSGRDSSALPNRSRRSRRGWRLTILRLSLEADRQELAGERRQAAIGDLADARSSVAHLLGHLGRPVAEPVAQLEQRPAADGELAQDPVQVAGQLGLLL